MKQLGPLIFCFLLGFLLACAFMCKRCGKPSGSKTITKIDTVFKEAVTKIQIKPVPYEKVSWKTKIITKIDSLTVFELASTDTAAIVKDYETEYHYSAVHPVDYGMLIINDTVQGNRIRGQGITLTQSIPEVTKTITLTQPKRVQLYAGIEGYSGNGNIISHYGAGLTLKTKNDYLISAKGLIDHNGGAYYGVGVAFKIGRR